MVEMYSGGQIKVLITTIVKCQLLFDHYYRAGRGWVVELPKEGGKYGKMALEATVGFHSIQQSSN